MTIKPFAGVALLAICVGCQERRTSDAGSSPRQEMNDATRAAQREAAEARLALSKRLDELDSEVEKVERKAERASAKTKAKLEEQANELRADARKLRDRMSTWDDKAESAWRRTKQEIEDGLGKAENSLKKVVDDIRN